MRVLRLLGAVGLLVAACTPTATSGTTGSGTVIGEVRDIGGFDSVTVSDGIPLILRVDTGGDALVAVHYDDNLLGNVVTVVEDGTLRLSVEGSISLPGEGRFVTVRTPSLVAVTASGGASVVAQGEAADLTIVASGGASVDAHEVEVGSLAIDAAGGASVIASARHSARVAADGGASVTVYGDPDDLVVEESGGASVSVRPGGPDDPAA